MNIDYKKIADDAIQYAKNKNNIELDFTKESISKVDFILEEYHKNISNYNNDMIEKIAFYFGVYVGETLLKLQLKENGYDWYVNNGVSVFKKNDTEISPVSKVYKQILNGRDDSIKSFCDVAFTIASGNFNIKKNLRTINVELETGEKIDNVLYKDIEKYIMLVENGETDFVILSSQDGFLQFYGYKNQFVSEFRVDIENDDFRFFSIIDKQKEHLTQRVELVTPYGKFTPSNREIVSLEMIRYVVKKYYENVNSDEFIKSVSCIETTEEMKNLISK